MTSRSWQYISYHWEACSNHLAISDILSEPFQIQTFGINQSMNWLFTKCYHNNSNRTQCTVNCLYPSWLWPSPWKIQSDCVYLHGDYLHSAYVCLRCQLSDSVHAETWRQTARKDKSKQETTFLVKPPFGDSSIRHQILAIRLCIAHIQGISLTLISVCMEAFEWCSQPYKRMQQ